MKMMRLLILAAFLLTSATGFSNASAEDLSGAWKGTWSNSNNRHTGPLRGRFIALNDSQYRAIFRGRFFGILPFRYAVVLDAAEQEDGSIRLRGSTFVSRLYGTFDYDATVRDGHFESTYTSSRFEGTFSMDRRSTRRK
ncbi:MAG: hypothetical protein CMJ75_05260 [Planctomycetaceae bacterium]|nr:hypothetical protein [Planctomycetaceae bacterium]